MNIALIYGGKSGEHEVSQVSASSVARHINTKKHRVTLISITKTGEWHLQPESEFERIKTDENAVLTDTPTQTSVIVVPAGGKARGFCTVNETGATAPLPVDVVLPLVHGTYGEDGLMQGLLEMADLPYWGCDVTTSSICMDKEKAKTVWEHAKLPVIPYIILLKAASQRDAVEEGCLNQEDLQFTPTQLRFITQAESDFGYPLFVKPCKAGSSVGASKAENREELAKAIEEAFLWDDKILVEKCVAAREIECSVIGIPGSAFVPVTVYTPGEIIPTHTFYDYEAKYTDPEGAQLRIPAELPSNLTEKIKTLAAKAYTVLNCTGFARIDFFADRDTNAVYLNEINTIPGFTNISMFPKMCEAGELHYDDLIEVLIKLALERYTNTRALKTSR